MKVIRSMYRIASVLWLVVQMIYLLADSSYQSAFVTGQSGIATPPKFPAHTDLIAEITDSGEHLLFHIHHRPI